jgi:cell division protein FtsQ
MNLPFALPRRAETIWPRRAPRSRRHLKPSPADRLVALVSLPHPFSFSRGLLARSVLLVLLVLILLTGGWLWLRNSPLVAVRQVEIAGVRGPEAQQIEAALRASARGMTTMKLDEAALRASVRSFPVVESLHVSSGFPHTVRIVVVERPAVAALAADGQRTAVAADGTVLGPSLLAGTLPLVDGSLLPAPGQRVSDDHVLAAVAILGAAPPRLARFVARVYAGPEGLTVAMRNGLTVYFGDVSRPHAKWLSLAAVLADPSSIGATYVDVRVPTRPAAGHGSTALAGQALGGAATNAQTSSATATPTVNADPAAAALAERLAGAVGGGVASTQKVTAEGEGSGGERSPSPVETAPSESSSPPSEVGSRPAPEGGTAPAPEGATPTTAEAAGGTAAH